MDEQQLPKWRRNLTGDGVHFPLYVIRLILSRQQALPLFMTLMNVGCNLIADLASFSDS